MRTDVSKMQSDIDDIKSKPAKRYDLVVTAIVTAIASGLVGFALSAVGMSTVQFRVCL